MAPEVPVLFIHWETVVGEVLDHTEKFPKRVRFTFAQRIDGLVLDILEWLVKARFGAPAEKRQALAAMDGALARLRVLLRLCHTRRYLDHQGHEHLQRQIDEAGRMVGGWRTSLERR